MAFYITHLFYLLKLARDFSYPHCCYEQEVSNRNGRWGERKHPSLKSGRYLDVCLLSYHLSKSKAFNFPSLEPATFLSHFSPPSSLLLHCMLKTDQKLTAPCCRKLCGLILPNQAAFIQ